MNGSPPLTLQIPEPATCRGSFPNRKTRGKRAFLRLKKCCHDAVGTRLVELLDHSEKPPVEWQGPPNIRLIVRSSQPSPSGNRRRDAACFGITTCRDVSGRASPRKRPRYESQRRSAPHSRPGIRGLAKGPRDIVPAACRREGGRQRDSGAQLRCLVDSRLGYEQGLGRRWRPSGGGKDTR